MNAHRTYLIFGGAAVLLAGALAVHLAQARIETGPGWKIPAPDGPSLPEGPARGAVDGTLRLSYAYTYGAIPESGIVDLVVDVDAITRDASTAPLDVAIVVDTSGSMIGDKIEKARAATREVLSQLRDGDRVTLVAYSTDARVIFPLRPIRHDSGRLGSFVEGLVAAGGTNIEDGLSLGLTELLGQAAPNRLQRIILISDGHATVGATDPAVLASLAARAYDRHVSVTTMGLGTDYNELSLTDMARRGGGNYYFIDDSAQLPTVLQTELRTLQRLVASAAVLHVDLGPGVRVERIYGFPFASSPTGVDVPLSAFHSGQNKSLVLSLRVQNVRAGAQHRPASFRLDYSDLVFDQVISAPLAGAAMPVLIPARGGVDPMTARMNRDAVVRVQRVKAAASYEEAMLQIEAGRHDQARVILRGASRDLRAVSEGLGGAPALADQAAAAEVAADEAVRIDRNSAEGKKWLKGNRYDSYKLMLGK